MDEAFEGRPQVFVDLYDQGLIYRDKRLCWDPGLGTAISDLEVETRRSRAASGRFAIRWRTGRARSTVATTRPETMLADMAGAVHPRTSATGDDRQTGALPITGRLIRDRREHADPALGTGAVKITPAMTSRFRGG